jgi:integrase/recombinase XerD
VIGKRNEMETPMDIETMGAEFKQYLQTRNYAKSTVVCYCQYLGYFMDYIRELKLASLKQVNGKHVRDYQLMVMEKDFAQETTALRIRPVKRLFEYLVESNRLLINPCEKIVETNRKGRKMPPVLTEQEMTRLLDQPNLSLRMQIRDRAIMEVFYSSAIRLDELLHLEVYHVDLKEKVLFIRKGKGNRQRVVPLGTNACKYLREYLEKIRPRYAKKNRKERKVFLTNWGKAISGGTISSFLRLYRLASKIKKPVSAHTFRRSCATHLLKNGADISYVQKLLGHKNMRTTQLYTKVVPMDIKETHKKTHPGGKL